MQFFKNKLRLNKTAIISALVFSVVVFLWGSFVFAQVNTGMEYGAQIGLSNTDPRVIIARVIQVALGFLGIIAVGLIMYAGWLWMSSAGSEDKIDQAKNILKNAIIGLVIILSSFGIASFILSKLMGAAGGDGGPGDGGGSGDPSSGGVGVLGSCTVESVYPEPSQQEVPRNTSVIVTFKEEVKPETICQDTNANGIFCDAAGVGDNILVDGAVKDSRVKIYRDNKGAVKPADVIDFIKEVKAVAATDKKTFVFTPIAPLGSILEESVWYTVYLSNGIEKASSGYIFDTCSRSYLEWNFEVNNKLDLTPPQIKTGGVSPSPASANPTNSVIQINFNEAINPITVSGSADEVKNYIKIVNATTTPSSPVGNGAACVKDANCLSFKCDLNSGKCVGDYLQGKFIVSNQYQTVEFLSDNQCGINGCGEKIYCLPASSQIRVELKAAVLADCGTDNCASRSPYNICIGSHCQNSANQNYPSSPPPPNGMVDMCFNSLDGNRDGDADGPATYYNENSPVANTGDNYQWFFSTSDAPDLTPPVISSVSPDRGALGANLAEPIIITFSKSMMSSSLRTGSMFINNGKDDIEHKLINLVSAVLVTPDPAKPVPILPGYWMGDSFADKAKIQHSIFGDSIEYRAQVGSGVKDIHQNCFKPSSGPSCAATSGSPSCCASGVDPQAVCP